MDAAWAEVIVSGLVGFTQCGLIMVGFWQMRIASNERNRQLDRQDKVMEQQMTMLQQHGKALEQQITMSQQHGKAWSSRLQCRNNTAKRWNNTAKRWRVPASGF